jgi:hypothetical protein
MFLPAPHLHLAGSLQLRMPSELPRRRHQAMSIALPDCTPFHDEHNMKEIFALFQSISSSRAGTRRRSYNEGQTYILFSECEFFHTFENKHVN